MKRQMNGHQVVQLMEQFSPKHLAMEGDPVGLQVGRLSRKVDKVLITLDVTNEVVEEAIKSGAGMIIAHHPLLFRPLRSINMEEPSGQVIEKIIKHDLTVFAAHTNLDITKGGVNDWLAEKLDIQNSQVLVPTFEDKYKKLIVFVPGTHEETVRSALAEAGAGQIGDYSDCSFTSVGTGKFKPGASSDPFIGTSGVVESVEEVKIEVIYQTSLEKKVLKALKQSHPYEEPAYDVFEQSMPGEKYGLGRVGAVEPVKLKDFAEKVKQTLDVPVVRVTGDQDKLIKKAAVLGGMGSKYMQSARFAGADVYITGDIDFHTAQDAEALGLSIIDPGHHVEKVMKEGLANQLSEMAEKQGFEIDFIPSALSTEPFKFV
ncbi:Nif3-like dinuclear metal center hexameric protein [Jeotgalibacillus sp. R-1-5s-1]|uniref:Nif3-like dinuclear metal center hexameric protein n=1 Tax=Jeotgalibacillus sp. R-1-5s-1 TaxID=2555897 RepID=UPI00106DC224|nr:Nif3-like dinuclear metal center hexameric protein [Jeotgalibacillus sp. R-1-5s-1]TFD92313.1 Nif3-like dinuclear metal center hexameric protein [Jeotgalibacillus sp. R-1-5s-1]